MSPEQSHLYGPGRIVVISGPSGCGKSTIRKRLLENPRYEFSVSATTREIREGEVDGVDYHFLTPTQFREQVQRGEFIEHAEVHGNDYGTPRAQIEQAIREGKVGILDLDVQGAMQLKQCDIPVYLIFVMPPNLEELQRRLERRGTETTGAIERRLRRAEQELSQRGNYDQVVVNDDEDRVVAEIRGLIEKELSQRHAT